MNVFGNGLIDDLFKMCNQYISTLDYEVPTDFLVVLLNNAQNNEAKMNVYLELARCFNNKKNSHITLACYMAAKKFGAECDEYINDLREELGFQDAIYDTLLNEFWVAEVLDSQNIPFLELTSKKSDFADSPVLHFYVGTHTNSRVLNKRAKKCREGCLTLF